MNVIKKKQIKYIKLCLISPWLEHAINILYLICLPLLAFYLSELRGNSMADLLLFDNYMVSTNIVSELNDKKFKNITSSEDLIEYIEKSVLKLYEFKNKTDDRHK